MKSQFFEFNVNRLFAIDSGSWDTKQDNSIWQKQSTMRCAKQLLIDLRAALPSLHFITASPVGRFAGAAWGVRLEIPHAYQQPLLVPLTPHQGGVDHGATKPGRRWNDVTWSVVGFWERPNFYAIAMTKLPLRFCIHSVTSALNQR